MGKKLTEAPTNLSFGHFFVLQILSFLKSIYCFMKLFSKAKLNFYILRGGDKVKY